MHKQPTHRLNHLKSLSLIALATAIASLSGCGVLIGNTKPVETKAENYGIVDLAANDSKWIKLPSNENDLQSSDISDAAYQARDTGAIISINSACRAQKNPSPVSLRDSSQLLVMGMTDITFEERKNIAIQDRPALETTIQGKMNARPTKIRTVVVQKNDCLFDLMYIARPEVFSHHEDDFRRFLLSLRLK